MKSLGSLALLVVLGSALRHLSASKLGSECGYEKGSFINLCGSCVGGSTGLQDSEGLDKCKVCFGSNECERCDDAKNKGCESQRPQKFDKAMHDSVVRFYPQSSLLKGKMDSAVCSIKLLGDASNDAEGFNAETSVQENKPYVAIDLSSLKTGLYTVTCHESSSNANLLNTTIEIVDSGSLTITSLSPEWVTSNVPFQAMMHIAESDVPKGLVCFTRISGATGNVVGARIVSPGFIKCSPMVVHQKTEAFIGVAVTLEAALDSQSHINLKSLEVRLSEPLIKRSTFSSDLRLVFIQFDQNIDPSHDCREAFSPETISLFGKGWHCYIQADQIVIQLGLDPVVHPGSRISLSPVNNIQQIHSSLKDQQFSPGHTTIVDDVTDQVVEPVYNILAPRVACYGVRTIGIQPSFYARKMRRDEMKEAMSDENSVTTVEVQQLGGQNLLYNWSVSLSPQKGRHVLSQRDMLMTWFSVRMLNKSVHGVTSNTVSLNNSLMLSNVDYTVTVKGTNAIGMTGEEKKIPLRLQDKTSFSAEHRALGSAKIINACSSGSPLDVMLSSAPATFSDIAYRVEVVTSCCGGNLNSDILGQIMYAWSVKSYNGSQIKIGFHQGKFLNIPPGTFHGGERYKIRCNLYHKTLNQSIGMASTSVVTLERGIRTSVNVSALGISTLQPLILDASESEDLDNKGGVLKFEWSCRIISTEPGSVRYGDNQCYLPRQKRLKVQQAYAAVFKKSILYLPAGSLAVGRYYFSVMVSRASQVPKPSNNVKTIEVSILGGSPPNVYIPTHSSGSGVNTFTHVVNPDDGVTLTGTVMDIKAGCQISWISVDQPGYITVNKTLLHQEPYTAVTDFNMPREFSVEILPGLQGDAKYRLRLFTLCKSPEGMGVETSYADFDIFTDAPPIVKPLKVEPLEGEALVKDFIFSTQPAYDDLLDYPLTYNFGFQILGEDGSNIGPPKFFHSSNQKLSTTTYLPALSSGTTKILSLLRVCDVQRICRSVDGPVLMSHAPKQLNPSHVEGLTEGFTTFLAAEEYEDAIMLVESGMATLEVFEDKSLYQLASQRVEHAINSHLDSLEKRLETTPNEVHSAFQFLKAANAALKHGSFSQETLQRLVAFKDKILSMLSEKTNSLPEYQHNFRTRRQAQTDVEQSTNILQPEIVQTFLSLSEVAIFNLSDTSKALDEKRKLLQNVSFFMDSLCRGLRNSVPLFIGSRVVSFSVQRLNMQVKYKDDLAIPDWRSSKSGGVPVNATAQICLGEDVRLLLGGSVVCMGAAYYPMDLLSEIAQTESKGIYRHSSIYHVKIVPNALQKVTVLDDYEGLDVKKKTVRVKIPIWSEQISSALHLECRVWLRGAWESNFCKNVKYATLINKPAVECLCSVVGFYAVFAVNSPTTTKPTTKVSTSHTTTKRSTTTTRATTQPSTTAIVEETQKPTTFVRVESSTHLPRSPPSGIPIPNTLQNFTFKIQEEFSATVGSNQKAFISQLKHDILKQVEMPANMIASIDIAPGSILVTLHLVDTDTRTVNDVLPSLAAVLQEGRLSVNDLGGRPLSVPPQSLKLLQRSTENGFVPWIVIGCTGFGLFSIGSLVIAAIVVKRHMRDMDFTDKSGSPEITNKTPAYGRFHLEQTLDGSEATLSRYRSSVNNPLVVSTIGGLASVMGTNAPLSSEYYTSDVHFMLQPPPGESKSLSTPTHQARNISNANGSSGNTNSSGNGSTSSSHRGTGLHQRQITMTEDNENTYEMTTEEEDSGIVINGRVMTSVPNNSGNQTPEVSNQQLPHVRILPGTPSGERNELSQTLNGK